MPRRVVKLIRNSHWTERWPALVTGSLVLSVGTLLASGGNYVFTLTMARLLTPAMYGDMVAIFAVGTILSVPTAGVVNIISRDVSRLKAQDDLAGIRAYLAGARKRLALTGAYLIFVSALAVPAISGFLHVNPWALMIYSLAVALMFLTALNQGAAQGFHRFGLMSAFLTGQVIFKLALGTVLVLVGFQLFGVVWSVVIAQIGIYLALTAYLRRMFGHSDKPKPWKLLTKDNQLVIGGMILMYLLFNLDLFFAKHYFPADLAGSYAVLSVLGKIIIFSTSSVAAVLLSITSERVAKQQSHRYLAISGLALVYLPGFLIVTAYAFFPSLIVHTLFPGYASIIPYLGLYGGLSLMLAVLYVLVNYFLAIRDYRFIWLLGGASLTAIVLMLTYHQSFFRLIAAALVAALVAVAGSLILLKASAKSRAQSV